MTIDLEVIKRIEPNAVEYKELSKNYMITLKDGSQVMIHKDLVNQQISKHGYYNENGSFNDGQTVPWSAIQSKSLLSRRSHTHTGMTSNCWECGKDFCRRCAGPEASFEDSYCGC